MALNINSTFAGVRTNRGNPAGPIVASDVAAVAGDIGMCQELLSNKKADGSGGAPTTAGHGHGVGDGEGNLLPWVLSTQCFGPSAPDNHHDPATFKNYQSPPRIGESTATTFQNVILFFQPIFFPAGSAGRDFLVIIEGDFPDDPRCFATISTWGTTSPPSSAAYSTETPVTGSNRKPFKYVFGAEFNSGIDSIASICATMGIADAGVFAAVIRPAADGLHTLKVESTVQPYDQPLSRTFRHMTVVPALTAAQLPALARAAHPMPPRERAPSVSGQANVTVGDPDGAVAGFEYEPVDSTLTATDFNLGPALEINNRNSALHEELARGLPAHGNTTMTADYGHNHDAFNSVFASSRRIEMCLGSWAFGSVAGSNAFDSQSRIQAPVALTTTAARVAKFVLYTPSYNDANTRLYCAVLVRLESGKATNPVVVVTSDPALSGASTATNTFTGDNATVAAAGTYSEGYQLITSATQLTMQSGGLTGFDATLKKSAAVAASIALMGMCLFIDE